MDSSATHSTASPAIRTVVPPVTTPPDTGRSLAAPVAAAGPRLPGASQDTEKVAVVPPVTTPPDTGGSLAAPLAAAGPRRPGASQDTEKIAEFEKALQNITPLTPEERYSRVVEKAREKAKELHQRGSNDEHNIMSQDEVDLIINLAKFPKRLKSDLIDKEYKTMSVNEDEVFATFAFLIKFADALHVWTELLLTPRVLDEHEREDFIIFARVMYPQLSNLRRKNWDF